jgi:hypothetical protein
MFQTIQLPTFLNFRPSLALRSVLLFAIACFSAIALPLVANYVMQLPGTVSLPFQSVAPVSSSIAESYFPASRTHQEPNFYQ